MSRGVQNVKEVAAQPSRPLSGSGLGGVVVKSGAIKGLQLLLGIGSSLLLARWLGAGGYGIYSFALALATLLAIPAQLGWPTLLTREVAKYQHDNVMGPLKAVLRTSVFSVTLSAMAAMLVCLTIGYVIGRTKVGQDPVALAVSSLLVPLMAWVGLRAAALRGLERVLTAQLLDGVLRPGFFLLILASLYLTGALSPRFAMYAQVAALVASLVIGSFVLSRALPTGLSQAVADASDSAVWRSSLGPLMFVSATQVVTSQAGLLVLGLLADPAVVGIYKVALMLAMQVGFATWLVNAVFAPRIVKLHRAGDYGQLRMLMSKGVRYVVVVAIPIAMMMILFGRRGLEYALGAEYLSAYWPMVIIAIGQVAGVTAGPVGIVLGMTGHERSVAKVLALATGVNVALTVWLGAVYGATGAAVALAASLASTRFMLQRLVKKVLPQLSASGRSAET